jgi:hypothetical protein
MRNNYQGKRRMSRLAIAVLAVGTIVFGGVGTVGTLYALGHIDLPFLHRTEQLPPGWLMVPVSGGEIPAYTKLSRDHIWDPRKGQFSTVPMSPDTITPEMIVDRNKIFGRVLDHEKPKGYAFTESDFFPKGTRPGLVAGIPAGKRSLTLEAGKLAGVFGLKVGDHVDLVATVPIDSKNGTRVPGLSGTLAAQQQMATIQKRASVRVLAQDAVIVSPVTSRAKPIQSNSLTNGSQVRTVPVQEIVIAVAPSEVAPISEAIATQVDITCVARSGLPDDPGAVSKTPGADPIADMKVVDSISGKKREALVFSADGSRVPPAPPETTDSAALDTPIISAVSLSGRGQ